MSSNKKKTPAKNPPAITPPGRVRHSGHGSTQPVADVFGVERLREVMTLSREVPLNRVCEDAAAEIERLRLQQTAPKN